MGQPRCGARRWAAVWLGGAAALAAAAATAAAPRAAWATGTLAGTITDTGGAPIAGMEVRAWRVMPGGGPAAGFTIQTMTLTNGAGAYALVVPADDYKVDARMPPLYAGNYGDRWYDVAAPASGGYVEADADLVTVPDGVTVSGVDIVLEVLGGLDGRVALSGGAGVPGVWVRAERNADPRVHHNDQTEMLSGVVGNFSFRGLVPAGDYQVLVYDPGGVYDTGLFAGPYGVSTGFNGALGNLTVGPYAADPFEPDGGPGCASPAVDYSGFTVVPPLPWSSSGTWIGPLGADVDWLCVAAMAGDRFLVTATTELTFGGATRYHPWTDPILSFWTGDGVTMLADDDDSGPGPLDAYIDTGPVPAAGCYCFVVSTFGDFGDGLWNGVGQASTGDYTLVVEMGNRPPALSVTDMGVPAPAPPGTVVVDEGVTLVLDLGYADPEGDPVVVAAALTDNTGAPVAGATLTAAGGTGSWVWPVGGSAGGGSPYTVVFTAEDAEFTTTVPVLIVVNVVNGPPTVPSILAPLLGATVATGTPALTLGNSTDPDGDPISYEMELHYGDAAAPVAQSLVVAEMAGGTTTTTPATIPENTHVYWRARATDGFPGGTSPWTPFFDFLVDVANEAPLATLLVKPYDGEMVLVRRPGLSASNTTDPEGNAILFFFEVAEDAGFATVVASSPGVPQDVLGKTTVWTLDVDLDWGATYYARARVEDDMGAVGGVSNVNAFDIKENVQPSRPELEPADACVGAEYDAPPDSFTVANVDDPEGEPVTLELEIRAFDDDPATTTPLVTASVMQDESATSTVIAFDGAALAPGHYAWRVRAFDGTDYSEWLECDFWVGAPGKMGGDEPHGCGCGCRVAGARASGAGGGGLGALVLSLALAVAGLRRRRAR
jgi:hypothetical protein